MCHSQELVLYILSHGGVPTPKSMERMPEPEDPKSKTLWRACLFCGKGVDLPDDSRELGDLLMQAIESLPRAERPDSAEVLSHLLDIEFSERYELPPELLGDEEDWVEAGLVRWRVEGFDPENMVSDFDPDQAREVLAYEVGSRANRLFRDAEDLFRSINAYYDNEEDDEDVL